MFLYLLLLLTIVPIVELIILFRIADRFQWGPTIALVLLTGILGAWLARREGLKTVSRIQSDLGRGVPPTGAMVDGLLILIAGAVLITPGILTDVLGFALLIPPCRSWIRRRLAEAFKKRVIIHHPTHFDTAPDDFVDVQATSRDADEPDQDRLP